jgi:oxygen-independent coproporphyrinogen III oxidase
MLGLYLHIPFCAQKCGYCDFNSYAGFAEEEQEAYVRALLLEAERWAGRRELQDAAVATVFIGGGTPSLLSRSLLGGLIRQVLSLFPVRPDAEVTLEANPGTVDVADGKLEEARAAGANRISFGVQAFQPSLLQMLGRIHGPDDVERSVRLARAAGFTNLNLDLMYGLPGQTPADYAQTIRGALSLGPEHVSAYSLIVEEGTPFHRDWESGRLQLPPEEAEEEMWRQGRLLLESAGLEHYEISNFARPGFRSRHNQVYWRNEEYVGLGCGAHSFVRLAEPLDGPGAARPRLSASRVQGGAAVATGPGRPGEAYRFWNLKLPGAYREAVEAGVLPVEAGEPIPPDLEMAETMMLGLRLLDGVPEERFAGRFGRPPAEVYGPALQRLQEQGLLSLSTGSWRLTDRGLRLANRVWAEFLPL